MSYNLRPRKKKMGDSDYEDSDFFSQDEEDSDYDPEEESEEEDLEDEELEEEDDMSEEEIDFAELGRNYRLGSSAPVISPIREKYTLKTAKHYTEEEKKYLSQLQIPERKKIEQMEVDLGNTISKDLIPLRFRVLSANMDENVKRLVLNKLNHFGQMTDTSSGEYFKLKNWLEHVSLLPFEKYAKIPVCHTDPIDKIGSFMNKTKQILNETVYGHEEAKNQILRILAQWISNPNAHGHCIGIHGPMGIGKTSLIKEGLSKALGIPFGFIALGGASDGAFLEGHSYTYEGSSYGKIAEILIKTQCTNPIFFFDELDKVSLTKKGEEIIGILTHLTDASQNEKFNDRYFGEIDINLSKSLIVFSYNDETVVNSILKDRLITIKVDGYKKQEKLIIAEEYLLPQIVSSFGFTSSDIIITKDLIDYIIQQVPEEQGVRNLKRGLEAIVSWINMYRYLPTDDIKCTFPFTVTKEFILKHLKKIENESFTRMYT